MGRLKTFSVSPRTISTSLSMFWNSLSRDYCLSINEFQQESSARVIYFSCYLIYFWCFENIFQNTMITLYVNLTWYLKKYTKICFCSHKLRSRYNNWIWSVTCQILKIYTVCWQLFRVAIFINLFHTTPTKFTFAKFMESRFRTSYNVLTSSTLILFLNLSSLSITFNFTIDHRILVLNVLNLLRTTTWSEVIH